MEKWNAGQPSWLLHFSNALTRYDLDTSLVLQYRSIQIIPQAIYEKVLKRDHKSVRLHVVDVLC